METLIASSETTLVMPQDALAWCACEVMPWDRCPVHRSDATMIPWPLPVPDGVVEDRYAIPTFGSQGDVAAKAVLA